MKGFTLIELLVVVLIVGILSAIALPQYELVVEKSRAAEAMVNAKAIQDACQRYEQRFPGQYANQRDQIADVQLKGGSWDTTQQIFTTDNFTYDIGNSTTEFLVQRQDGNEILYSIWYPKLPNDGDAKPYCSNGCTGDYEQITKLFTNI